MFAPTADAATLRAQRRLSAWRDRGHHLDIEGRHVFVLESGNPTGVDLVLLHGFPSCSYDMHRVLPLLASERRVVVHDHPGLGLSDKNPEASYSLLRQADTALAVWDRLGVRRAHLVAHDYGTSVATELLARREEEDLDVAIESLTLANGSIFLEMARLLPIQRLLRHPLLGKGVARFAPRSLFHRRMRHLWGGGPTDAADLEVLWRALTEGGGRVVLPKVARYLDERRRHRERWIEPLSRFDRPALVLWGRRDPVAVGAIAARLAETIPAARLVWLEAGHYPMLEVPRQWAESIRRFVARVEALALADAQAAVDFDRGAVGREAGDDSHPDGELTVEKGEGDRG